MTNLSFDRRNNHDLVLVSEDGAEFILPVTEQLLAEVRIITQQQRGLNKIQPALVQKMLRAGASVEKIAAETGFELNDVQRFEAPIKTELSYMLERAMSTPVRTNAAQEDTDEKFGAVIQERLTGCGAAHSTWRAYKTPEKGWQIELKFKINDVLHCAIWSFDSRKMILAPQTQDAIDLSKQGDVSEVLIPKLHAVQATAASESKTDGENATAQASTANTAAQKPQRPKTEQHDPYVGATYNAPPKPVAKTASLLDALRRKRDERAQENMITLAKPDTANPHGTQPLKLPDYAAHTTQDSCLITEQETDDDVYTQWEQAGFNTSETTAMSLSDGADLSSQTVPLPEQPESTAEPTTDVASQQGTQKSTRGAKKKNRPEIPEWDDILFGSRSNKNGDN
ncbi:DUF3071 domain-containing protein [Canibacter sp. lx-45]|uniref:septation protein SepH n=1 Tax=Canibacter zhuwentaonis TaxID=2837491 RepID=UPI001BDC854E|nr:septation protein SepH [Canibacter zhuwentaonis]MBT1035140.1 DUF3071 domain-containing protein [Canibacter zhuwentaonis]